MNGYELSQDGMTLKVRRHVPAAGMSSLHRQPAAGPFTDADILTVLTRFLRPRACSRASGTAPAHPDPVRRLGRI